MIDPMFMSGFCAGLAFVCFVYFIAAWPRHIWPRRG